MSPTRKLSICLNDIDSARIVIEDLMAQESAQGRSLKACQSLDQALTLLDQAGNLIADARNELRQGA